MATVVDMPGAVVVPTRVRALYGAGGVCDSVKSVASGLYLLFFYTTVLGLPGTLVGAAAALGLLWDALSDPIVGSLSDRSRSRWGRRHAWMIAGACGMAVGFFVLFSPPAGLSTVQLFAWLVGASLLLRTSHSIFTVPYYALGAELAASYDGRTSIAGYRAAAVQMGAVVASGLAAALFFPAAAGPGSRLAPDSYRWMALTLGVFMCAAGLTAAFGTWRYRHHGAVSREPRRAGQWRTVVRNRSFALLAGATSAYFLAMVFSAVLSIYFLTYFAAIDSGRIVALCQFALYGGATAGIVAWARLARRADKHQLFCAGCVALSVLLALLFWGAAPGQLPVDVRLPFIVLAHAALGAAASGPAILAPSMLADVAEHHELQSGVRSDGVFFGMFSASQQVATGAAAALAGPLVDRFAGLVAGSVAQAPLTVTRLGMLACLLPGALLLVSATVILAYDLTRDRVHGVKRQLIERTCEH